MPDKSPWDSLKGIFGVLVLLAGMASTPVAAQVNQTFEVQAAAETRQLLARAETLLGSGQSQGAYELLRPYEVELAGNPYYDYLFGVAALDTGRNSEAIFSLRRSLAVQPLFSGARMELARAYYEAGDAAQARPLFVGLLGENPPPGVRAVLNQYIGAIDLRPPTPKSDFSGYVEVFAGNDTNANGSTGNQQFLGFTLSPQNLETESPFYEIGAGFNWLLPRSSRFAWVVNARAGQRENNGAPFVDSTLISGFAGTTWQRGAFFGRAGVESYWAARDGEKNEVYAGLDLLLGRRLNEQWDLSLGLRGGVHNFEPLLDVLDVDRYLYTLGLSYRFSPLARLSLDAIGGTDDERTGGSPYGNSKIGGRLSLHAAMGNSAMLFASVGSLTSDYDGLFFGVRREDTQSTSILQVEFPDVFTDGLSFIPRVRYIDNDSDVALYDYDRTEIGLLVRWTPR